MARVLVVDDEPRITSFVSRALSAEGLGVDQAQDGVQGLRLARTGLYELVVLDLLMPGLDGLEVLRGIMATRPDQRVLVLSAVSDVDSKVRALELGASDYLAKPFALAELLARVRARLRQPPTVAGGTQREGTLRAGPLTLDLLRRVVHVGAGQRRIVLSDREFRVLQHLMRRPGEVSTRGQLLADVWGYSFDPGSNVVDVYVGRLRGKIGTDLIETVRNVGYRLACS